MKRFKFLNSPNRVVRTEMEIRKDEIEYNCPDCGQKVIHGINGNKKLSVSYPKDTSVDKKLDHSHVYPTYIDTEYFASRGLEIPAISFGQKMKDFKEKIFKGLKKS